MMQKNYADTNIYDTLPISTISDTYAALNADSRSLNPYTSLSTSLHQYEQDSQNKVRINIFPAVTSINK